MRKIFTEQSPERQGKELGRLIPGLDQFKRANSLVRSINDEPDPKTRKMARDSAEQQLTLFMDLFFKEFGFVEFEKHFKVICVSGKRGNPKQ